MKNNNIGFIKKIICSALIILFGLTQSNSQTLVPYLKKDGKFVFADSATMRPVLIANEYDWADFFHEGLARVMLNKKFGFIDKTGKEIVPVKYDWADALSGGVAKVSLNNKSSFIDNTGKEIVGLNYDVLEFNEGIAMIKLNEKWGFIDKKGKEIVSPKYESASGFRNGMAAVKLNGKWGFIDNTGKEAIALIYDDVKYFSEGIGRVKLNEKKEYNQWGCIDKKGKQITPRKYQVIYPFKEGLAYVEINGEFIKYCGFIDKQGREIFKPEDRNYSRAYDFFEGLSAAVARTRGQAVYIDKTGKEVLSFSHYGDFTSFNEGMAAVSKKVEEKYKWGFIDKTGKEVVLPKYDDVMQFNQGLAKVKLNGKWGFIDKQGNEAVAPEYDDADNATNGLFPVKQNGKWGMLNQKGETVVPFKYDAMGTLLKEGYRNATINNFSSYIDINGRDFREE